MITGQLDLFDVAKIETRTEFYPGDEQDGPFWATELWFIDWQGHLVFKTTCFTVGEKGLEWGQRD